MIPVQWPDYLVWRDQFAAACDPKRYPISYLDQRIIANSVRLFTCEDAALIVELRHYPTGAFDGHVLIAAGSPESVVSILRPQAEEWLQGIGALGAIVESRPAWVRHLKPHGYAMHQIALRKDLA